ncbi:MAG: hypothetical protein P8I97_09425 [Verrucomicrobiales bacterium]|nr:hypothetical protein [Verrucomicrobiales bacterium]
MAEETTTEILKGKIESLEERVNILEANLQDEREDLEKLKEVADQDHKKLESIKSVKPPTPTPVTPVGL